MTTSQQNGFKQVGRSNHRSHNGLRKDLAKRTMAKPLDPLLGHHITVGVVGTTQIFSTALWDLANSRLVYSLMLSSNHFFYQPCLLLPFTVPCAMVLAKPDERETCPYHFSLYLFTMVRRSSCGPIARWILGNDFLVSNTVFVCVVSCGSTSFPGLVFFFGALL